MACMRVSGLNMTRLVAMKSTAPRSIVESRFMINTEIMVLTIWPWMMCSDRPMETVPSVSPSMTMGMEYSETMPAFFIAAIVSASSLSLGREAVASLSPGTV